MRFVTFTACLVASLLAASCTPERIPGQPPVQRERTAYLRATSATPVTCSAAAECAQQWARAEQWVMQHSVYSIKTHNDHEIVTNGPIEPTTDAAFTVTRTPEGSGYRIDFASDCGQGKPCVPTKLENNASFNHFVMYGS